MRLDKVLALYSCPQFTTDTYLNCCSSLQQPHQKGNRRCLLVSLSSPGWKVFYCKCCSGLSSRPSPRLPRSRSAAGTGVRELSRKTGRSLAAGCRSSPPSCRSWRRRETVRGGRRQGPFWTTFPSSCSQAAESLCASPLQLSNKEHNCPYTAICCALIRIPWMLLRVQVEHEVN